MAHTVTGAFSGQTITVDALVKEPRYIQQRILEDLDKSFLEEALFRNGGPNEGIVAYTEATAPYMLDDDETVAEYAEIPLTTWNDGKIRSLIGTKTALGFEISREQRKFNKIDRVNQGVTNLKNTMTRSAVNASLAAFESANVPVFNAATSWESEKANPLADIRAAKRMISQAKTDDERGALFGYKPDTLVISESALDAALFHDSTLRFFNGNAALESPVFKGVTDQVLNGLRIVTSSWLEEDTIIVLESGTVGFYSDADPLTVTEVYSPNGENGYGGFTQSWRVDAFRNRIIAVDNPKAAVRLEGALA